jgi:UDP-N-acetylglucosamine:LPS N-acetylglucosamine transferase
MKVLAIASAGGHWIQLLRLKPAFEDHELIFMSTKKSFADTVKDYKFYYIPDANRNDKLSLFRTIFRSFKLVMMIKPDIVITTGAAPGLMGLLAGRVVGARTIWIDSVANVEKLSMSGIIASKFADKVYSQWEHLSSEKILYSGSVIA